MKKIVRQTSKAARGLAALSCMMWATGLMQAATPETISSHTVEAGAQEHWTADKTYTLAGNVVVKGQLTIDPGTVILAQEGFDKYILVDRGGQLYAEGTAESPITFKADRDDAGSSYWGGIIINGKAPVSGGIEGTTEINADYRYGGTDPEDNSGTMTYVKLINTGARVDKDIEHNGLTLNAVGRGTKIENLYIATGGDDAIEFFGGTVNVTNLLVVDCEDDCFDFTQGYCGTLRNAYGYWSSAFSTDEKDPRGIEADGNLDGKYPEQNGQSDFRVENVTFHNNSVYNATDEGRSGAWDDIIKIRRGAKATIVNALALGAGKAGDGIDMTDSKGDGDASSSISLTNHLTLTGNALNGTALTPDAADNTGCDYTLFDWVSERPATGIGAVEADAATADNACYDLSGRRIDTPARGSIYIQNGRKHIAR